MVGSSSQDAPLFKVWGLEPLLIPHLFPMTSTTTFSNVAGKLHWLHSNLLVTGHGPSRRYWVESYIQRKQKQARVTDEVKAATR